METLEQYETTLSTQLSTVTLIGQLGYDAADLEALRDALRPLFVASAGAGLKAVGERYPLTFALYLVLEGLYNYEGGDYWSGPRDVLRLTAPYHTATVGDQFRSALRRAGLPTFEHLGGHVHVTPILAHGGIPNYCLNDFFDLLDRATRRAAAIDAATLMDEWADGDFPVNIDRPVQRFLLHAGDIAEEFISRCLELWGDDHSDPESLDLPARVLERYDVWRAQRPRGRTTRTARLSRPKLVYDPYGEGIALILQPVLYAAPHAPKVLTWQIVAGDRQRSEDTYFRRLGPDIEFTPRDPAVNVLTAAPAYTVTALADGAPLQAWTLPGPTDDLPLLAFDAATGELLADRQRENTADYWLTPGERQLIFPRDWLAQPAGARKLAQLPDFDGAWARFAAETWLLESDGRLDLTAPDGRTVAFRARNDPPPARPTLDGAPLIAAGIQERFDLYSGRPPLVCIPPGRSAHDPAKWHIAIMPAAPAGADPPTPRAWSLADLPRHCVMLDGNVLLSLDAPELLGPEPIGEFHIHLRGPYGRQAAFDLRFAPGLAFEGYPRLHLSLDDAPTQFSVSHAAGYELSAEEAGITLGPPVAQPGRVVRTLTAAPALTRLPLVLRGPRGAVAFDLPVYRLRVGLVEPEQPDGFHWATTPLRLHPEALDAPHSALLRADAPWPPGAAEPLAGWRLVDADGRVLQEQPPRRAGRHPQTGLAEWLDTFRHAGRVATLQLVAGDGSGQETAVDVARLLPTLELGQVETAWQCTAAGDRIEVVWETSTPARNRQLRLWPVDQPWATMPITLPVPNDAADCAAWALPPGRVPAGEYLAEMVVVDPWIVSAPERPTLGAPNTFLLQPDDIDAALEAALARARRDELTAEDALVWIIYLARTRRSNSIARFNISIWRERKTLSLGKLLIWVLALRLLGDSSAYKLAQKGLFEEERITELATWTDYARQQSYLAHLPDGLEADVYGALLPIASGASRRLCLTALCAAGDETGLRALLADVAAGALAVDAAAELLRPVAPWAADFLLMQNDGTATEVLRALLGRGHNKRIIIKDTELRTNAGDIRVTGIRDSRTKAYVDACSLDSNEHMVMGRIWSERVSLPVFVNLSTRYIQFLKSPVFQCQIDGCESVYGSVAELNKHYLAKHRIPPYLTGEKVNLRLPLTHIEILPPDGF